MKFDYIIIGSGVAGLYFADNIPKDKNCLILCKSDQWACNTFLAQGGIAVSKSTQSVPSHIADTMAAGAGLCDKDAVELLCNESVEALRELVGGGMKFDTDEDENILFTKEAAHSEARIVHADGDATGKELYFHLAGKNVHRVCDHTVVVDLLVRDTFATVLRH